MKEDYVFSVHNIPASIRCSRALNHWAHRILTAPAIISIDGKSSWSGSYSTPSFKESFKNETEMKAYAKDHGCISIEKETLSDLDSIERHADIEKEDKLYKAMADPATWETRS